ncbi:hypothetical protein [Methylobacterium sp. 10]|uniref:hypothetical protein n=1 Tax=Methylobacterium sp. 10 TaxID=1101191 RepID=UPI0004B1C114|nr:hypothetical protein [Methylobacterium sp. 10]
MNLLIRPCLAAILALVSTMPFAQSSTPRAGRIVSSWMASAPIVAKVDRRYAHRRMDRHPQ